MAPIWIGYSKCSLVAMWRHTGSDESVKNQYRKTIESPPLSWLVIINFKPKVDLNSRFSPYRHLIIKLPEILSFFSIIQILKDSSSRSQIPKPICLRKAARPYITSARDFPEHLENVHLLSPHTSWCFLDDMMWLLCHMMSYDVSLAHVRWKISIWAFNITYKFQNSVEKGRGDSSPGLRGVNARKKIWSR